MLLTSRVLTIVVHFQRRRLPEPSVSIPAITNAPTDDMGGSSDAVYVTCGQGRPTKRASLFPVHFAHEVRVA